MALTRDPSKFFQGNLHVKIFHNMSFRLKLWGKNQMATHLWPVSPFYTPQKTIGFLVFSRGVKWELWPEMGKTGNNWKQTVLTLFTKLETRKLQITCRIFFVFVT